MKSLFGIIALLFAFNNAQADDYCSADYNKHDLGISVDGGPIIAVESKTGGSTSQIASARIPANSWSQVKAYVCVNFWEEIPFSLVGSSSTVSVESAGNGSYWVFPNEGARRGRIDLHFNDYVTLRTVDRNGRVTGTRYVIYNVGRRHAFLKIGRRHRRDR